MATVYSYCRFSFKRQESGDSLRRQLALGKAWMNRHPEHVLDDTLRLRDLGIPAFRGANLDKDKGDLGKFVHLAKQGRIPKGSILMLENLDRFSRQPTRKAYRAFCELVEAGVRVLTLSPEQMIDQTNIDNMEVVIPVIVYQQLAYEESRKKRDRIAALWNKKREAAQNGQPMSRRCPSWLRWDKDKWVVKPEGKAALQFIFKRTNEGCGQKTLTYELNKRFKPLGRSKVWNGSFLTKVLNDRAVLGELQCYKFTEAGERIPDGPPIPNYYPAVIDEEVFLRAQVSKANRVKQKGPSGKFVNLFTGLVVNELDGHPCHIFTTRGPLKGQKVYVQRRLVSYGHLRRMKNACPLSYDYYQFEEAVLSYLVKIDPREITNTDNTDTDELPTREAELQAVESRLAELTDQLEDPKISIASLNSAIAKLETKRVAIQKQIDTLRQTTATAKTEPIRETKNVIELLQTTKGDELRQLRLRLRALLANVVDKIYITPYKCPNRRVKADIGVLFKGQGQNGIKARAIATVR